MGPLLTYQFCVWARLGPGAPASAATSISLINSVGYATVAATPASGPAAVGLTQAWQRCCLRGLQFGGSSSAGGLKGYFTVPLAVIPAGTLYLDDAVLEASSTATAAAALPSPSPSPSPVPAPKASPSPTPSPSPKTSPSPVPKP